MPSSCLHITTNNFFVSPTVALLSLNCPFQVRTARKGRFSSPCHWRQLRVCSAASSKRIATTFSFCRWPSLREASRTKVSLAVSRKRCRGETAPTARTLLPPVEESWRIFYASRGSVLRASLSPRPLFTWKRRCCIEAWPPKDWVMAPTKTLARILPKIR